MRQTAASLLLILCCGVSCAAAAQAAGEEYSFDASAFHKKSWEFGGYAQFEALHLELDDDTAGYILRYTDDPRQNVERFTGTLELEGLFRSGSVTGRARSHSLYEHDHQGGEQSHTLYEAALSVQPEPSWIIEGGKIVTRWGKGYAWNPVGFIERAKDPEDPALSREGYWMLHGDLIESFSGTLSTLACTVAVLPVYDAVNSDFGDRGNLNVAAKLYLLYGDTDLDFNFLAGGSRSDRVGFDIAGNLAPNFEVHGEFAYLFEDSDVSAAQTAAGRERQGVKYLLGLRYLTSRNITVIAEYYRNGAGYSEEEMRQFFRRIHAGGADYPLSRLRQLAREGYSAPNPGRQYLYLRAIWKEPFDYIHWTPSLTSIVNVEDQSFSLTPELTYRWLDNLELRFRLYLFAGDSLSEYGEKPNDYKLELRLRYSF